jgi:hypothetical protein
MAGENIPIDYLCEHLLDFQIVVTFMPGEGYLGMINFESQEVYRSSDFYADAQVAFDDACHNLEENYLQYLSEVGK